MRGKSVFVFIVALIATRSCFALGVEELRKGLNQALTDKGSSTSQLAAYVTGYIHGSAEYARTLGLVCDESGLRSTHDELNAVHAYIDANPDQWADGAQLLINRALISPKCNH
ncbi:MULTISPECIES: hypothetical protein [Burkholderia]|uniref:Uncharacterized protein n=1 Tax=Burkholderia cenocepacia TaxID=95486 RepID=A0A6J5J8C2_9BURK|nr:MULTISPECIES: hypothetical protein [Burkholderia]MBN3732904.1 hypothetical protein [Burkholderia sp. Tr-20390]CAB3967946.1 hypothetical protein BCO9919_03028 [Burkholderia cenocepacia]